MKNVCIEQIFELLQYNLRALKNEKQAYTRPGYEASLQNNKHLETHDLKELVQDTDILNRFTSISRILRNPKLNPYSNLAELEHYAISERLNKYNECKVDKTQAWLTGCWWLTGFPQKLNKFRDSQETVNLYLVLDEEKQQPYFMEKSDKGHFYKCELIWKIVHEEVISTDRFWLKRDYHELLDEHSAENMSAERTPIKYGEISIMANKKHNDSIKKYSDQYGLEC